MQSMTSEKDQEEGGERRQNETGEEEEPIYRLRDDDGDKTL